MHQRTNNCIFLITFICFLVLGAGCSDNTIVTYVDGINEESVSQVELYFPLNEGYTTVYTVSSNNGATEETVTFQASERVPIQGIEAVIWIGRSDISLDTGYFYAGSAALYYYDDINSVPEKVLDFPLVVGNSWTTNDINTNDYTDIITGSKDDGGGANSKTFPTISAINFSVDQIEQLVLNSGDYYSNAVRVSSYTNGKYNYYWYVQGIGLVRYVIGATVSTYPNGEVVGELIEYGY